MSLRDNKANKVNLSDSSASVKVSSSSDVSQAKVESAVSNNQLISLKEGEVRKKVGIFGLLALLLSLMLYPATRDKYGPVSILLAAFVGVYRTGSQSLWGCVVNLKWNVDGKGKVCKFLLNAASYLSRWHTWLVHICYSIYTISLSFVIIINYCFVLYLQSPFPSPFPSLCPPEFR